MNKTPNYHQNHGRGAPVQKKEHPTIKLEHLPDGGVIVDDLSLRKPLREKKDFFHSNLADVLSDSLLSKIGLTLKERIEEDQESQKPFFNKVAQTIKYLGLQSPDDIAGAEKAAFDGASQVYSSALLKSCMELVATLDPVLTEIDTVIVGDPDEKLEAIAKRKKEWFNYYLKTFDFGFQREARKSLFWTVVAGSCYKKIFIDPNSNRPRSEFIPIDHFIVHERFSSGTQSTRQTHVLSLTAQELKIRQSKGIYRKLDVVLETPSDTSELAQELDRIQGVDRSASDAKEATLWECHTSLIITEDPLFDQSHDLPSPYIITLDSETGDVLSIYRNWEEGDSFRTPKKYFVNYSLLPALQGTGYGLTHYGGLNAEAATAITRQLMNSGSYASFPGGVYAAGTRLEENTLNPSPGEWIPIATGGNPIESVFSPLPYREPSSTLYQLKGDLENNIESITSTITKSLLELNSNAPASSTLAILDQLQKVPNLILQGVHHSFTEELSILNDRFYESFESEETYPFKVPGGAHVLMRNDFSKDVMVIPSNDPVLKNSAFRFLRADLILKQAQAAPEINDVKYAYEQFYRSVGLTEHEIDKLILKAPPPEEPEAPQPQGPIEENQALMQGQPVQAFLPQNHEAHIVLHQTLVGDPEQPPEVKQAALAHIQEHRAQKFFVDMEAKLHTKLPEDMRQLSMEQQNQIAVALAERLQQERQEAERQEQPAEEVNEAKVLLEQVKLQKKQLELTKEIESKKLELKAMDLELREQKLQAETRLKEQELQEKYQLEQEKLLSTQEQKATELLLKDPAMLHNIPLLTRLYQAMKRPFVGEGSEERKNNKNFDHSQEEDRTQAENALNSSEKEERNDQEEKKGKR